VPTGRYLMARVVEQMIAIKLSKIVKDSDKRIAVLDSEQMETLLSSIPELAETAINDSSVVVEIIELE
jgi:hypothetical protein